MRIKKDNFLGSTTSIIIRTATIAMSVKAIESGDMIHLPYVKIQKGEKRDTVENVRKEHACKNSEIREKKYLKLCIF